MQEAMVILIICSVTASVLNQTTMQLKEKLKNGSFSPKDRIPLESKISVANGFRWFMTIGGVLYAVLTCCVLLAEWR